MTDSFSPEKRSWIMSRIKSKDTSPEIKLRSFIHRLGYRFRLHRKDLPGNPDLVFVSRRKIIFLHGCFWHGHNCPRGNRLPGTNTEYWRNKIMKNVNRDLKTIKQLESLGWSTLVIWECDLKDLDSLYVKIKGFID